jgi:hypothetical protein
VMGADPDAGGSSCITPPGNLNAAECAALPGTPVTRAVATRFLHIQRQVVEARLDLVFRRCQLRSSPFARRGVPMVSKIAVIFDAGTAYVTNVNTIHFTVLEVLRELTAGGSLFPHVT